MRHFNTAGVCQPTHHYMLPPEQRLPDLGRLVDQNAYLIVHAPRQTGKTTTLRAFAATLTAEGRHAALLMSCEGGQVFPDNIAAVEQQLWRSLMRSARAQLPESLRPPEPVAGAVGAHLEDNLARWAQACPRPIVLVLDEIDALIGDALISVLRQLRAGHPDRPQAFPASVILCGLRDVQDYKLAAGGGPVRPGSPSPFNILVKSMTLGNFTEAEVSTLYAQHTLDTGQPFTDQGTARAYHLSGGHPWLVNALAREVIEEMGVTDPITAAHMDTAAERLILARATHLDNLVHKLSEPRVRRVIEPVIAGNIARVGANWSEDVRYVRDLGLIAPHSPIQIANPIYREVIVRVLADGPDDVLVIPPTRSFIQPDGTLDLRRILEEFAVFWREHGDALADGIVWHEVAAQLVLMAYLQRVVNGGGFVTREYGIGRGRIDLLVRWPHLVLEERHWQREALELKAWRDKKPDPLSKGLQQLDGYLDRLGLDTGVLVLFDRRSNAGPIHERTIFSETTTPSGKTITLLRA